MKYVGQRSENLRKRVGNYGINSKITYCENKQNEIGTKYSNPFKTLSFFFNSKAMKIICAQAVKAMIQ